MTDGSAPARGAGATMRDPFVNLWHDGKPVNVGGWLRSIVVEERVDGASSITMKIRSSPVDSPPAGGSGGSGGNWDTQLRGREAEELGLPAFRLLSRVTAEFGTEDAEHGAPAVRAVVFDGYLTNFEHTFAQARVPDSYLMVTGVDASALMHFQTVSKEWYGRSDSSIAKDIFGSYGFKVTGDSVDDTGPVRDVEVGTMIQRSTDAEFLRMLARRNGFELFVAPSGDPVREGPHPKQGVVGHFRSARTGGAKLPPVSLFPSESPTLKDLKVCYDSHQPTRSASMHIDDRSRMIQRADITDPGYARLGRASRGSVVNSRLKEILGGKPVVEPVDLVSNDVPHHGGEVRSIATAHFRESDWFATAQATLNCDRYSAIARAGRPVELRGAGALLDGVWYVRSVCHRWAAAGEQDQALTPLRYEAGLELVRNGLEGQP